MKQMTVWFAAAALALTALGLQPSEAKELHPMLAGTHLGSSDPAPSAAMLAEGKKVYAGTCFACHDNGVAGAPKLGDKAAWRSHLEAGPEHLLKMALKGEGAMPPRGGNPSLSDEEVRAAVTYMMEKGR